MTDPPITRTYLSLDADSFRPWPEIGRFPWRGGDVLDFFEYPERVQIESIRIVEE